MNYRVRTINNRHTLIINDNKKLSNHVVFYNYNLQNYYVYVNVDDLGVIDYLVSNNVGTISEMFGDWKIITLNALILL